MLRLTRKTLCGLAATLLTSTALAVRTHSGAAARLLALALLPHAGAVHASDPTLPDAPRIVVVDVERLLSDSPRARATIARIEAEFAPRHERLQASLRQLRARSQQLADDSAHLSDREEVLRTREVAELERNLRREQSALNDDIAERTTKERDALAKRIYDILHALPSQQGVDLVLTRTIWRRADIDITDKISAQLGH